MSSRGSVHMPPTVRWWLAGSGLDFGVDTAWYVVLGWLAVRADDVPTAVILALAALPRALSLVGGALADRWGVVRTTNVTLAVRAGLLLALAGALTASPDANGFFLAGLAITFGVVDALHMPAMSAIVAHLIPDGDQDALGVANGRATTVNTTGEILAAPVTGFLIGLHVASVGWVGAALLVIAFGCFYRLRRHVEAPDPEATPPNLLTSIKEGAGFYRNRAFLLVLAAYFISNLSTTAPVIFGIPLQARDQGWSGFVYGTVALTYAAGMWVGGLGAGRIIKYRKANNEEGSPPPGAWMGLLAAAGCGVVLMGFAEEAWQLGGATFITGLLVAPTGAWMKAYVQARTPVDALARVGSLVQMGIFCAIPIGHLLYGLLAEIDGPRLAGAVLGGLLVLTSALGWVVSRRTAW